MLFNGLSYTNLPALDAAQPTTRLIPTNYSNHLAWSTNDGLEIDLPKAETAAAALNPNLITFIDAESWLPDLRFHSATEALTRKLRLMRLAAIIKRVNPAAWNKGFGYYSAFPGLASHPDNSAVDIDNWRAANDFYLAPVAHYSRGLYDLVTVIFPSYYVKWTDMSVMYRQLDLMEDYILTRGLAKRCIPLVWPRYHQNTGAGNQYRFINDVVWRDFLGKVFTRRKDAMIWDWGGYGTDGNFSGGPDTGNVGGGGGSITFDVTRPWWTRVLEYQELMT